MSITKTIDIDDDLCAQCGLCGKVCPLHLLETLERDGRKTTRVNPERAERCLLCGHCAAVCPKDAISVEGLPSDAYAPSQPISIDPRELMNALHERRSMRRFKKGPVARRDLDQIVEAALASPYAGRLTTRGVITVVDPVKLKEVMALAHEFYNDLMRALRNPISRFFVKRSVGKRRFETICTFVRPNLEWFLRWNREDGRDEISREAPAVMIFHGPAAEPSIDETCVVMATQAMTMAACLGVGSLMNGLIPPVFNRIEKARELIGLPKGHEAYMSLCLGYPKHSFRKRLNRPGSTVRFV